MNRTYFGFIFTAFAMLVTAACSGDSITTASGGIGGTGAIAAVGTITAKGSITVNGVKYETDDARVFIEDDEFSGDSRLRVGMVVRVEGTQNADGRTGKADVVLFDDSVEGPITWLDEGVGEMEVLGQIISVDDLTRYEPPVTGIGDLSLDDIVEVSGQFDDLGNIRAGFVEKKPAATDQFEVTGFVSGKSGNTFFISGLKVDFSIAVLEDFGVSGVPQDGDFVEVTGKADQFTAASGSNPATLVAGRVENKISEFNNGQEVEAEGFVQDLAGDRFTLVIPSGPQAVQFDDGTEFAGGSFADLQDGLRVEAEGIIVGGVLIADQIEFNDSVLIEAVADSTSGRSIALRNLSAITVIADARTRLVDNRSSPSGATNPADFLADIKRNDSLKIRGRQSNRDILATELEVEDPPDISDLNQVQLQGPVDIDPTDTRFLSILSVLVDTVNVSEDDFLENEDDSAGRFAFFSAVTAGTVVEIDGDLTADNFIEAAEVELEDD